MRMLSVYQSERLVRNPRLYLRAWNARRTTPFRKPWVGISHMHLAGERAWMTPERHLGACLATHTAAGMSPGRGAFPLRAADATPRVASARQRLVRVDCLLEQTMLTSVRM